MPTLKQITCTVEWDNTKVPFKEYGAQYGDGIVECLIAIPEAPVAFTIHLQSKGYIAPGLAMFIYVDGVYQCNRNRFNLKLPDGNTPNQLTEVDFRVRQKEERRGDGGWIGRNWRFENLRIVNCGLPEGPPPKEHFEDLGTLQIIVLRCQPEGEVPSLMQTGSRMSTRTNSPTSRSRAGIADIFSVDGSKDKPFRFGLDGPTDWGTGPTWGFDGRDSNQGGNNRQWPGQGSSQQFNHHGNWDRPGPPNSPTGSLFNHPHPGPSRGGFPNTPYGSEHGGGDRNRSEWGDSQPTVGPSASVSQANYPVRRMDARPIEMLTPSWLQHGASGPGSNWGYGSGLENRQENCGNRSNIGSQLGDSQYGGVQPGGSQFGGFNYNGPNNPRHQQTWNNNGGNSWHNRQNSGSFGGRWPSNNDGGNRYGAGSNAGNNNDGPNHQPNSWGHGGGSNFNNENNPGDWSGANNSSNFNNQGGSNYRNSGNNASSSNNQGGSNNWGNGNDNGNQSANNDDSWDNNQGRNDNRDSWGNNQGNGRNSGSNWGGSQGNRNTGGNDDGWQNDNKSNKNDSGGNDTWGNDNNSNNNESGDNGGGWGNDDSKNDSSGGNGGNWGNDDSKKDSSGGNGGNWGNNDSKNGSSGENDDWGANKSNSGNQGSDWDSGNSKNDNSGSNNWGNSNDTAQDSGNNNWNQNTSPSKPASVAGSQGPGFVWVTPLGSAQQTDEPPLYTVPEQVAQDMKASHQVQPGQSIPYTHKLGRPAYMDSFEVPYARFIFRYRTKETIEQELGITIERDKDEEKRRLATLSKDQIIELLLGAQDGHHTQTCTPVPCSPVSYSPSKSGQSRTFVTPKNINSITKHSSEAPSQAQVADTVDTKADVPPKSQVLSIKSPQKSPVATGNNTTRNTRANTINSTASGKAASIPPAPSAESTSVPGPPEPTPAANPTSSLDRSASATLDIDALAAKLNALQAQEEQAPSARSRANSAASHASAAATQVTMPGAWNFEGKDKDDHGINKGLTGGLTPNQANASRAATASSVFGFDGQNQDRIGGRPTSVGGWNPWIQ